MSPSDAEFLQDIERRLGKFFSDSKIVLRDFSREHQGHFSSRHSTGTHLELVIQSSAFRGLNRLQRERMVHAVFSSELQSGRIHALVLKLFSDEENLPT